MAHTENTDEEWDAIIAKSLKSARNIALDAAIDICDELHAHGLSAGCCAEAIRRMQVNVNAMLDATMQALSEMPEIKH